MKKIAFIVGALLIGIVVVAALAWHPTSGGDTRAPLTNASSAEWISKAVTVEELMAEADLVVRVRVARSPVTRIVRNQMPIWENGKIVDSKLDEMPFSDTVMDVVQVYAGKSPAKITVMQTGGVNPANPGSEMSIIDDPLYQVGEEYILFLVDISNDPVQAPGRELYRTVNPAGRYKVAQGRVSSYAQNVKSVQLPTTVAELEAQIGQLTAKP